MAHGPAAAGETVVMSAPPAPPAAQSDSPSASTAPSKPVGGDPEATSAWAFDAADVAQAAEPPKTPAAGAPTVVVPAVAPADAPTPSNGFTPPAAPAPAEPGPSEPAPAPAEPASAEPAPSAPAPSAADAPAASPPPPAGAEKDGDAQGAAGPQDPTAPEPIIPESWFAQPKRPQENQGEQGQAAQAQQPPPAWGMAATPPADNAPPGATAVLDVGASQPPAPPTLMDQGMYANQAPGLPPGTGAGGPNYGAPFHNPAAGQFTHPIQGADTAPPDFPPYPADPHAKAKKGVSKPLLITVSGLVVAALVSVGLVMFSKDDTKSQQPVANAASPSPAQTASAPKQKPTTQAAATMQSQAKEVNAILAASRDTHNQLKRAVGAAGSCKTLPQAMAGFQTVKTRRTNQLRRTQALKLDKVPNGERLRASMQQAFQASLQADQALITWGQRAQRNCRGKPRPAVSRASGRVAAERKAIIAKRRLVAIWNPIAKKAGLPHRIAANL
ncbi:hypothetical protein [Actinomadura sp. NBRC 104425]|uniref:hypothetical protein n=1 Tax=Actinomadura sp. NBRC 104425 TaxID=3032204 RepID=UPI002555F86A|nr:hypothetical protein [Actinomadura sp. NBRC 104425]